MDYKILIKLFLPELEQSFEMYIPVNRTIGQVIELMNTDPNIETVARNELFTRYNSTASSVRGNIANTLNTYAAEGQSNVESGVQEEITRAKEERQSYLEALGGY